MSIKDYASMLWNRLHFPVRKRSNNTEIKNKRVVLDWNSIQNSLIEDCVIVYWGHGPLTVTKCNFVNCRWEFKGPAARTLKVLLLLNKDVPSLIAETFNKP